ncbi:MAG: hypothetical protein QF531_06305, partial [Candidatus Poseidonia sp.]|nr:hypothetical protein [Poseidonia sp.]
MELHGDMVEHGQPVITAFHRPRAEAHLLSEQGFEPRAASFQFVNIATADMGPWMQQLVNNEGWLRSTVELAPTPFSVGLPTQRPFEAYQTLCFRHPSLPALDRYFLPFPPESLPGKCFVSLPRRAAAEMARQQAEVLGVGRLEKPLPQPEPQPAAPPATPSEPEVEPPTEAKEDSAPAHIEEPAPTAEDEAASVPLPPSSKPTQPESEDPVPLPTSGSEPTVPVTGDEGSAESVELPEVVEEEEEISELEKEVRAFFRELIDAGVEPSEFMDDPRWEDLNERCIAEGLESWPILLQMTAMG